MLTALSPPPSPSPDAAQADIDSFADHRASLLARAEVLRSAVAGAGVGAAVEAAAPSFPVADAASPSFLAGLAPTSTDAAPSASGFGFM